MIDMNHKTLQNKYAKLFQKWFPKSFYYKIPDTAGLGGLRPYDSILLVNSVPFAIEYKVPPDKMTKVQLHYKKKWTKAGGQFLLILDKDEPLTMLYNIKKILQKKEVI